MKRRRQGNWDPDLGLAILAATQYPPHTQQVIANYMGLSRQRVEQIEKKALRKVRVRLMRQPQVWEAVREQYLENVRSR
jgi:Sigma-70, region 4